MNVMYIFLVFFHFLRYDVHVAPYFHTCDPCFLSYDVIGRTETTVEDTGYILDKGNINETLPENRRHFNKCGIMLEMSTFVIFN